VASSLSSWMLGAAKIHEYKTWAYSRKQIWPINHKHCKEGPVFSIWWMENRQL